MIDDLVAAIHSLHEYVVQIHGELADVKGRMERTHRSGTVTDVDAKKQQIRVQIGEDDEGNPHKTPWIPYSQFAGSHSVHMVPSVGQQMHVISPDGEHEMAHAYPLTWSDQNKSPSDKAGDVVSNTGGVKMTDSGGTRTITGNVVIKGTLTIEGSSVKHNGKNIGDTHKHTDVEPGGGQSGPPA